MKVEKIFIYLGQIHFFIKKAYSYSKKYKHLFYIRYRAWRLNNHVDKTVGDKLRTLAAKADAIEEYYEKYCNEKKVGRLKAHTNKKWYNKHKNTLKKEIMLLNYNY